MKKLKLIAVIFAASLYPLFATSTASAIDGVPFVTNYENCEIHLSDPQINSFPPSVGVGGWVFSSGMAECRHLVRPYLEQCRSHCDNEDNWSKVKGTVPLRPAKAMWSIDYPCLLVNLSKFKYRHILKVFNWDDTFVKIINDDLGETFCR